MISALILALTFVTAGASTALAATNPYQRGPAPTLTSVQSTTGPFAVGSQSIVGAVGFGGGQLYYPTDTSNTYGAVVILPGFLSGWSELNWLGPQLASQGFVVIGINTSSLIDLPDARGKEALAALDWATGTSPVANRIDKTRLAVAGWSMGGGGLRIATTNRPSLKAAIGLAPWNTNQNWSTDTVPTLLIGGSADLTAPPWYYARPFYHSITATAKAYLELRNADHNFPTSANATVAEFMTSWLKRWVDNDTRYTQFLCPGPSTGSTDPVDAYLSTCPF